MLKDKQRWESTTYKKVMEKTGERKSTFDNSSGYKLDPLYVPENVDPDYNEKLGFPGEPPFTRGVYPTMYRGRFWTMRQYAGFGTVEQSNERYRYLLDQGQTGLSIAFDLPTQMGYDSDSAISAGEVGKVGVAVDSLADMEVLFKSIPLDKVSTSMTINATASVLLCMYIAVGAKQGVSKEQLRGTIQNDILKEYIARGTYIYPPKPSMRLITDIFEYCTKEVPKFNTISISGYHIREAGSTAVQEVAFTLADAIAYVEAAISKGLDIEKFAKRLSFFFNVHNNILEEVAKFRAARRMWWKIMEKRFNAKSDSAKMLRFHTQTAGSTLTAQQYDNNVVRVAIQALAAVLGGTQSLHTNSRDEALALPTEDSVRIALRTQQIIAEESGAADVIDPLGGSWYLEKLTNDIEKDATEYLEKIDSKGGAINAIEQGYIQREIQEAAYKHQKSLESKEKVVVGVNSYQIEEDEASDLLRVDPIVEENQLKKLGELKKSRNNDDVTKRLSALENAAETSENLIPYILEAVNSYATIGEISNILRKKFGEYKENVVL